VADQKNSFVLELLLKHTEHENTDESVEVRDNEIDLREIFRVLWARKWLIGGTTFAGTVVAVIIALMLPNIYRAEALLAPNQNDGVGNASARIAQFGGLASLAGINMTNGSSDKTALSLEILKSRQFISEFVKRHDILPSLMASTGWDSETGLLIIDSDVYDSKLQKWVRDANPPRKATPSPQEAYQKFSGEILSVIQDQNNGFVTVVVEHYSPAVAKQWVDWLVQDINASVMQQDVDEAERSIKYLEEQIAATSLADLQNVFFQLIEEQTKTVMLAKVSPEYMFRTIDPAVVPELKAKPQRAIIAFLGMVLGGMFGVIVASVTQKPA